MKLQELYEDSKEESSYSAVAKREEYKRSTTSKKIGGKFYDAIILAKTRTIKSTPVVFTYIINPETHSWTFEVGNSDIRGVEIDSGEDEESLIKHLKKKKKLSTHNFEKYFQSTE